LATPHNADLHPVPALSLARRSAPAPPCRTPCPSAQPTPLVCRIRWRHKNHADIGHDIQNATLAGIEIMNFIRKGQFRHEKQRVAVEGASTLEPKRKGDSRICYKRLRGLLLLAASSSGVSASNNLVAP
jgi:hypothetical protein